MWRNWSEIGGILPLITVIRREAGILVEESWEIPWQECEEDETPGACLGGNKDE